MNTFISVCYAIVCTIAVIGGWCILCSASKCCFRRWRDNKRGHKPYRTLKESIVGNPSYKFGLSMLVFSVVGFLIIAVFCAFYHLFS